MHKKTPHHIIAIGASAGGLDELKAFFDHTPLDGVAYIIIPHLSADFKSRMVQLLARHSKLEVMEAAHGKLVQSNEVYLIPTDKFMTIQADRLYLSDKINLSVPHLTINTFFHSLAIDCGQRAIGIILSGFGSDGSEGIKSIKNAGGLVIVRNPETTEFNSMPTQAIATGMVDFVLEPEQMPDLIEVYSKQQRGLSSDQTDEDNIVASIIDLININSPLDFSDYKQSTILRRTKRRAALSQFTNLENYLEFLKENPVEVEALSRDYLISVSAFFRDKEAFHLLQTKIIPALLQNLQQGEELRFWVAGCATGEEAYSMAMLVLEQLTGAFENTTVKIFATDIDNIALLHAGKGLYTAEMTKEVSAERLERHFIREGEYYRINPDIRKMVIFAKHDLVKNPPYCNMHLISCRNLLIYLSVPLQKKIYAMLLFGLKKEGYLFLGSSESPLPILENLQIIGKKEKIYKNLGIKRAPVRFDSFSLPELGEKNHALPNRIRETAWPKNHHSLAEAVNTSLAKDLNCLVVCVDEKNQVVKTYGDTTKYLLQKNFTTDLLGLLPRPLAVAYNTLSSRVLKANKKGTVTGIIINQGGSTIQLSLTVSPLPTKKGSPFLRMVRFSEEKRLNPGQPNDKVFDEKVYLNQYTVNLEEEVRDLKEKLQTLQVELEDSNENMLSFNEELLSANEELQSANEEMQSINEELHTINADYQLKNRELIEVNDDLNNYFRSNINGQLFVNNDLLLMKFSPGAVKQVNLLPTDIGRPLSNISTNIKFETIIDDIKQVLDNGENITKEVEAIDGRWYQLQTMPYIQLADNSRSGAILTFTDITNLKKIQQDLDKKNESLTRINADLENFAHTASHDLLAPLSNIEGSIAVINNMKAGEQNLTKFLEIINLSIKKFKSLLTDLATVAKVESNMLTLEMVDVVEILDNVEWSLDSKIKDAGAIISRDLKIRQVLFSKKNLRSILFNLIANSIKFRSEDQPVIKICTVKEGENIILSVEDNGIGIPSTQLSKIFDLHGRLHAQMEGQGIGLYLARKMVHTVGGNIIVESEVGKGSIFKIYLKAAQLGHGK